MLYNRLYNKFWLYLRLHNMKKAIHQVIYTPLEHEPVVGMLYIALFDAYIIAHFDAYIIALFDV